uniref:Uncharacterized protein n=1 Tax=Leersia perrieri TaxID=77586 RepID=A0A0D9X4S0_9ORYZ
MAERRLGRGRNASRRRCWWCDDGRMSAASARRTCSPPSTAAMRTPVFAIADRLASPRAAGDAFLCSAQRNEPGCVVGEHEHSLLPLPPPRRDDTTAAAEERRLLRLGWRGEDGEHVVAPAEESLRRELKEAAVEAEEGGRRVGVVDLAMALCGDQKSGARFGCGSAKPRVAAAASIYRREKKRSKSKLVVWLRGPSLRFSLGLGPYLHRSLLLELESSHTEKRRSNLF